MGCGNSTNKTIQPIQSNQNNSQNQQQNNPGYPPQTIQQHQGYNNTTQPPQVQYNQIYNNNIPPQIKQNQRHLIANLPPEIIQNQQDLMFARNHIEIPEIVHEESFLPVQVFNPEDITTQIVAKQPLTKYQRMKQSLGGQKFVDQEFPCEIESLTPSIDLMDDCDLYEWKRIEDIFTGKYIEIFQGQIEPNDIVQGELGDCYFLSALSILAEKPVLIQKIFIDRSVNQEGIFGVFLCIDGEFQEVLLDSFFPTLDGQIAFSNSNQKDLETMGAELWVIILEKAYAKMFGSYYQIYDGMPEEAIRDFTGAPYDKIFPQDQELEETWKFLTQNVQQGYIVTATSNLEQKKRKSKGIEQDHSYSILDTQSISHQGQEVRLIKARNPWGKKEWTGDWSDKSDKWTPELRQQLQVKDEKDGIFWICLENFTEQFEEVAVNYVRDGYLYTSKKINFAHEDAENMLLVTFSVEKDYTHVFLDISQKDLRHFPEDDPYDYSYIQIMVCNNHFTEWKGEQLCSDRNMTLEGVYNKGTYTAYIQIDWDENSQGVDFVTFSAYSSSQVLISDEIKYLNWDDTAVLDSMLICQPPERDDRFHRYEEDEDIIRYEGKTNGYFYYQYVNTSKKGSILTEFVEMKEIENVEIMAPYDNSDEFQVEVKPLESKLVKYRIINFEEKYKFTFDYKSIISLGEEQLVEN